MVGILLQALGAFLLAPLGLLALLLLCIYRLAVQFVAFVLRRDYDSIVSGLDAYFLVDRPHDRPHFSLSPCFTVDGRLDVNDFKRRFLAAVQLCEHYRHHRDPATCRLFQYPERFGGFHFWKWDPAFDVNQHIVGLADSDAGNLDSSFIYEYVARDLRTPHPPRRPLWKIAIAPGHESTLVVFRFHHALMDATSFFEFIQTRVMIPVTVAPAVTPKKEQQAPGIPKPASGSKLKAIRDAYAEFQTLKDKNLFLDAKRAKKEQLPLQQNVGADWVVGGTARFALSELKPARDLLRVSSTALFLSVIAGGLQAYMERYVHQKQRPASVHFLNPFPPPDGGAGRAKNTMGNYFTMATLNMKLQPCSLRDRIQAMHAEYQRSSHSPFPVLGFGALKLLSVLPIWLQAPTAAIGSFTCIFSNIAGPPNRWNFFGHEVTDFHTAIPLPNNRQSFGFMLVSYNGQFRIVVTADRCCVPTQVRMDELCGLISAELESIVVQYARHS